MIELLFLARRISSPPTFTDPDEQGIAANRLADSCYDSNLPTGCHFIVGRPLSMPEHAAVSVVSAAKTRIAKTVHSKDCFIRPRNIYVMETIQAPARWASVAGSAPVHLLARFHFRIVQLDAVTGRVRQREMRGFRNRRMLFEMVI
jgi:hypothetical protein